MPDLSLDPSALTVTQLPPSSSLPSKLNVAVALPAAKAAKATNAAPRVDLEPLYTSLKASIGEYWAEYKEAISLLLLGSLNQREFCLRTEHFLSVDPAIEHQHNQLVAAIFCNAGRDPPEPGVAPFVSANDKPVVQSKPTAGDAVEQRLKAEVMQLPARDRRRLKDVPEPEFADPIPSQFFEYQQVKRFRSLDYVPPTVGGKTNWDLEIKKRYIQPLAAESGEFPDAEVIQSRMVPICYSESLADGAAPQCAGFMATATEHFIKELLSEVYARTRSNLPGGSVHGILTHRFKSQLQIEEDQFSRHEITKVPGTGLLPVEAKEAQARSSLAMHDLKVALNVGDVGFGQFPLLSSRIMNSYAEDEYEEYQTLKSENMKLIEEERRQDREREERMKALNQDTEMRDAPNGAGLGNVNGVNGGAFWEEDAGEEDWGWDGGNADSRAQLSASLDQCLAIEA